MYVLTMVPTPRVMSMIMKSTAQRGAAGNFVTARGYTTNASPGPGGIH